MSALGLDSGYTPKYGLSPREFPQAAPSVTPLGSGHISPYIPRLVLIRIQCIPTSTLDYSQHGEHLSPQTSPYLKNMSGRKYPLAIY